MIIINLRPVNFSSSMHGNSMGFAVFDGNTDRNAVMFFSFSHTLSRKNALYVNFFFNLSQEVLTKYRLLVELGKKKVNAQWHQPFFTVFKHVCVIWKCKKLC